MKRVGLALSAAALVAVSCGGGHDKPANQSNSAQQIEQPSTVDHKKPIEEGLELFRKTFGCPVKVTVEVAPIPNDDLKGVAGAVTVAISNKPGQILVNPNLPKAYDAMVKAGQADTVRIGVHESTHACQTEGTHFAQPIQLPNQDMRFTGVQGLTLITDQRTEDGTDFKKFNNVEEGAAEVIATELEGAKGGNPDYARYENITRQLMDKSHMDTHQLEKYVQTNDIYGFLSQVSGIAQPGPSDLLDLVRLYND